MPLQLFGEFGFSGPDDTAANPFQDRQLCLNWYPEVAASRAAKVAVSLLGCPGLIQLVTAGPILPPLGDEWPQPSAVTDLPVRGSWVLPGNQQALCVIAATCYLVTIATPATATSHATLALTSIGTLLTDAGPVVIRDNGVAGTAVIVDGPYGYYYGFAAASPLGMGTFQQITDPAFLGADRVAYIDGWWIFNQPGTQTFYTNAQAFSVAFDGSYFALKDAASDQLMTLIENKEELWLVGERTSEIWYNAGGQYFAFQRLAGAMLQVGCKAKHSIARLSTEGQEGLCWFGRNERGENIVVRTQGFAALVISTPAVSTAIAQYPVTEDAIGYTYQDGAHEFYVLTFPTADKTWVFDSSVPLEFAWHQRASYDPYAAQLHRHRSNSYMNFAGMRVVGDYQNGSLYQMTRSAFTDAGWPILARRRAPHLWDAESRQRVFMARLQVEFQAGSGLSSGIGSNPTANLRLSRDGGVTYGQSWPAYIGQIGRTLARAMWRKLGFTRDTIVEIEVIDPVNRDIVGATIKAFGEPQ
jgi:hypothetical protein